MTDTLPLLLPTVPGKVHGIVSIDPPTIRCDGCGYEATGDRLGYLVVSCGIKFNPAEYQSGRDTRRLCRTCRKEAGWEG